MLASSSVSLIRYRSQIIIHDSDKSSDYRKSAPLVLILNGSPIIIHDADKSIYYRKLAIYLAFDTCTSFWLDNCIVIGILEAL
jgi:hypothetical protein